ncbi:MAG: hypothetical protein AAGF20_00900 [Pseudomonadota bacterium]
MTAMTIISGLPLIAIALATLLSALIRTIQTTQLHQRVRYGLTSWRELSELSGIADPRDLQDVFGPPSLDRVWQTVKLPDIQARRRLAGYLMSDLRLHGACALCAVMALPVSHWSTQLLVCVAALAQAGGWLSASQLPRFDR